ncbi:MAG: hypothetical protein AAB425_05330 [Bdellovibrionota bacterium]
MAERKYIGKAWFTIALIATSATSCRVGNKVEYAPQPDTLKNKSGYYETELKSLRFCAVTEETICTETVLESAPELITSIMGNPVALIVKEESTGEGYLVNPADDTPTGLPIFVDKDNKLTASGAWPSEVFWKDEKCTSTLFLLEDGSISRYASASTGAAGYPISGRMEIEVQVILQIDGDTCKDELTKAALCHEDATLCEEATEAENTVSHDQLQAMFKPYIDAGTMTAADIPGITILAYSVYYK